MGCLLPLKAGCCSLQRHHTSRRGWTRVLGLNALTRSCLQLAPTMTSLHSQGVDEGYPDDADSGSGREGDGDGDGEGGEEAAIDSDDAGDSVGEDARDEGGDGEEDDD